MLQVNIQLQRQMNVNGNQPIWTAPNPIITPTLTALRSLITNLRSDYSQLAPSEPMERRIHLIETQLDGLLRKSDQRSIELTQILNEKENQIVQLEKKIENLQEKLQRSMLRQVELQNVIVSNYGQVQRREEIITQKSQTAQAELQFGVQVRQIVRKLKYNIEINSHRLGDTAKFLFQGIDLRILSSLDISPQELSSAQDPHKTSLVQLFREVSRLHAQPQGITEFEIERILEGFLLDMKHTKLYAKMKSSIQQYRTLQNFNRLKENFSAAAGLYNKQIEELKNQYAGIQISGNIFELLMREGVTAMQTKEGKVFIEEIGGTKVIEVPIQNVRSKQLLHALAMEMRRLFTKYPKLQGQIDGRLVEFFQSELIEEIGVDEMDRIVDIVKYVPQTVRVEDVYSYKNDKTRKTQFHLRVLLKAILEEVQKNKERGMELQMDESVLNMIKSEIMDIINLDDILKVYRVVSKIVEVEKVVQKIVQRVVEVPQVIIVQKTVEKIVEVQRIREVDRKVNVFVETPVMVKQEVDKIVRVQQIVERIVQVPTICEKVVELTRQVPKVVEVVVEVQKIVQVEKVVEVERIVNHVQQQMQQIEVIVQRIVEVEKIVEKIVEVPVIVEKIVEKTVEVIKMVQIEKIVEKIVPVVEYRNAREVQNLIEVQYEVVDRIVQRLVPVEKIVEKIVIVPQIVEVVKTIYQYKTELKEVEVLREKLVIQEKIKEVELIRTIVVEQIREVIKEVEKVVRVPFVHQKIITVQEIVEKPIIQRIETVKIQQVRVRDPLIVKQTKIVEVDRIVNHYIEVPKLIKYFEDKIVEVPKTIDRIKEVRVVVEKLIQKMVEVPRIVEVEKIVERIVVVPRVIQKVVEVPKIVEVVVEREVVRQVIREVQKVVQVPVFQERIVEVKVFENVIVEVEKVVERVTDKIVEVPRYEEKIITEELIKERTVQVIREVPRVVEVDRIVPQIYENMQIVEVTREIIVPIQIPVPLDVVKEKLVPVERVVEKAVVVPQIIEKIVPKVQEVVRVHQIEKIVEKLLIEQRYRQIEKIVPYYNEIIKEVPTIVEKVIPIQCKVQEIVTAQQIIEKIVQKTITLNNFHQIECLREKLVQVPKLIEIQRIVPQIIYVNKYIQKIVEKIIQIPILIERMKAIQIEKQKIVEIKNERTQILEVEKAIEKLVFVDKIKEMVRTINHIQHVLQVVDRYQSVPVPIHTFEERFVEVPMIIEKIVQKIVVMPQIVEVLKYVHEITESEELGVAVETDVGTHEAKYKQLSANIRVHLEAVTADLKAIKDSRNQQRIEHIQHFLAQLTQYILFPRIVKIVEEKIVEKPVQRQRIVRIPMEDPRNKQMELSLTLLAEKLILELKRIQTSNVSLQLDEDIRAIFFSELTQVPSGMERKLMDYTEQVIGQFQRSGTWTIDQQSMLTSFLQERFLMAQLVQQHDEQTRANKEQSIKQINEFKKMQGINEVQRRCLLSIQTALINFESSPRDNLTLTSEIKLFLNQLETSLKSVGQAPFEITYYLPDAAVNSNRINSLLRERQQSITKLKAANMLLHQKLVSQQKSYATRRQGFSESLNEQSRILQENNKIAKIKENAESDLHKKETQALYQRILELETEVSHLKSANFNLEQENRLRAQDIFLKKDLQERMGGNEDYMHRSIRAPQIGYNSLLATPIANLSNSNIYKSGAQKLLQAQPYTKREESDTRLQSSQAKMPYMTPVDSYKFASHSPPHVREGQSLSQVSAKSPSSDIRQDSKANQFTPNSQQQASSLKKISQSQFEHSLVGAFDSFKPEQKRDPKK